MSDELKPCPFCGSGTTQFVENGRVWSGMKYTGPISVSVQHWCDPVLGQPSRGIERVGRDKASAITLWNKRADSPDLATLRATITRLTAELDEMHMRATVAEGMQRLNAAERDRMGTALSQLIAYAETSDNAQYFTLSAAVVEEIARAALQEPK